MSDKDFFDATNSNISYDELYSYVLTIEETLGEVWNRHKVLIRKIDIKWHEMPDGSFYPSIQVINHMENLD